MNCQIPPRWSLHRHNSSPSTTATSSADQWNKADPDIFAGNCIPQMTRSNIFIKAPWEHAESYKSSYMVNFNHRKPSPCKSFPEKWGFTFSWEKNQGKPRKISRSILSPGFDNLRDIRLVYWTCIMRKIKPLLHIDCNIRSQIPYQLEGFVQITGKNKNRYKLLR